MAKNLVHLLFRIAIMPLFEILNFNEIYRQHKNLVYNLALQYAQNTEDAEEIAQDVFVSVHQNLEKFKQQSEVKTWVYRITINKSLDFIKAKNRQKRSFLSRILRIDDETTPIHLPHFDHPGALLESKEQLSAIFSAINTLPDNQKTVVILLKIEDKTQAEVAQIMELSIKAVESLFQRAKKNLEKTLNRKEGI